jgi:hypothetical protein
MDPENAVIEREDEQLLDTSSDDLRSALTSAFAEVNERARDEQGRFAAQASQEAAAQAAAKPAVAADANQAASAADTAVQDATGTKPVDAAATQTDQAQATAVKPPDSWSPAAKAKFATLDPDVQAEIARREAEVHKGFTKQDEHRNLGKSFESTVAPYLPMIKAEGSDPVKAAAALLQSAYTLRAGSADQKEQLLISLMGQYQIDPQRVFQRLTGGQQAQSQVDPQVAALTQQVQQLQQRLTQGDQQTEQAAQAQINTTIEAFASDPKNIYFANVKPEMAALMRDGRAQTLQEAYDMACWARPDIRPLMQQQIDLQKQAEARARTQKARAAGSTLTGSPTGSVAGALNVDPNRSLRDEIAANLREVASRE